MKIGICDDDVEDLSNLDRMISEIRPNDEIICFTRSKELLEALRNGMKFFCLFLDILMPEMNGMELVSEIRKEFPGKSPYFAFITSSRDYAVEAFAHRAVHYIVKPFSMADIAEVFSRIPVNSAPVRCGIHIKIGSVRRFLYLDEIAVCESESHKVKIKLFADEILTVPLTFEQLRQQVGSSFIWISRGILVNPNYIAEMGRLSCTLQDGRKILFSRARIKQIQQEYDNFIFDQLTNSPNRFSL